MSKKNDMEKRVKALEKEQLKHKPELRQACSELSSTALSTAGTLYDLTYMPIGDDNQIDRIGDQIRVSSMKLNYILTQASTSNFGGVFVRYIVVRSKIGELVSGDFPNSVYGCPDHSKYWVLKDVVTDLRACANNGAGTNVGFTHAKIKMTKRYKNGLKVQYVNTLPDSKDNGLYMWVISGAVGPKIQGYHLMSYYDN